MSSKNEARFKRFKELEKQISVYREKYEKAGDDFEVNKDKMEDLREMVKIRMEEIDLLAGLSHDLMEENIKLKTEAKSKVETT